MSRISKTVITFTVLHRTDDPVLSGQESIGEYNNYTDGLLGYVMSESWDGGMVGAESDPVTTTIDDGDVAYELGQLGNDGTFFDNPEEEGA